MFYSPPSRSVDVSVPCVANRSDPWKLVILGDSWAANEGSTRTWPQIIGDLLGWPTLNLATVGAQMKDVVGDQYKTLADFLEQRGETLDPDAWVIIHAGGNDLMDMCTGMDLELIKAAALAMLHQPHSVLRGLAKDLRVLTSRLHLTLGVRNLILSGMPLSPDLPCVSLLLRAISTVAANGGSLAYGVMGALDDTSMSATLGIDMETGSMSDKAVSVPWPVKGLVDMLLSGLNGAYVQLLRDVAHEFRVLVEGGRRWAKLPKLETHVLCINEVQLIGKVISRRKERLKRFCGPEELAARRAERLWSDPLHMSQFAHRQLAHMIMDTLKRRHGLEPSLTTSSRDELPTGGHQGGTFYLRSQSLPPYLSPQSSRLFECDLANLAKDAAKDEAKDATKDEARGEKESKSEAKGEVTSELSAESECSTLKGAGKGKSEDRGEGKDKGEGEGQGGLSRGQSWSSVEGTETADCAQQ
uniref:Uncharacterized protein n=1 Tax=Haptolina brevifila TaxID=156173 RepID=A0A7S2CWR3_9EUKA|mmetsp:Transcript_29032/g.58526  ORF Transcript_29032/g.58526 Transcript_29032/m.58526 type:complete len:471 (+) Transcript_29032:76-1488(+)